jgi:predicted RNase H-like HicB family nuclease
VSGHYVAIAECPTAPGEAWRISFPSFPGVTAAADTPEEITAQAHDALTLVIEGMIEDGQAVPGPFEEAGLPEYDLTEFESPLVLLVPSPGPADTT